MPAEFGTPRKPRAMCEVDECRNPALYPLYKTLPRGKKRWLEVCREHEQEIGDENMRMTGGRRW